MTFNKERAFDLDHGLQSSMQKPKYPEKQTSNMSPGSDGIYCVEENGGLQTGPYVCHRYDNV